MTQCSKYSIWGKVLKVVIHLFKQYFISIYTFNCTNKEITKKIIGRNVLHLSLKKCWHQVVLATANSFGVNLHLSVTE